MVVNGKKIQGSEFDREVGRRLDIAREKNPKIFAGRKGEKLEEETRREVATEMIRNEIIREEAEKLRLGQVREEAYRKVEEEKEQKGYDAFTKELKRQHLKETEYIIRKENELLVDAVGKKVCEGLTVSRDEAESFYLTHKSMFAAQPMVRVEHILLDSKGQAQVVLKELEGGKDFETLAKEVSKDDATRNLGGLMGWIEKGTMDPAFEEAAFSLKSGQISGVVEASDGFHIIKVLERREAYIPPFSEVEDEVRRTLLNEKKEEKFTDWLRTVYANAEVRLPARLGRWDPALGKVVAR